MANPNRKDWSRLLEDALWAHRIVYQTLLGMSPYQIVFVKQCNLAYDQARKQRKLQLQELEEFRLEAFEKSWIYKKEFRVVHKVLLFNSRLKLIAGQVKASQPIKRVLVQEKSSRLDRLLSRPA
ncbi:hypothetical protein CR513_25450, partial [Mucuna pruriens]